jgi:hypothetical protein
MKTKRSVRLGLLAGALACVAIAAMPGCELLVDFDRSKIPVADASVVTLTDAPTVDDGSAAPDAGSDAAPASPDATSDAAVDASTDAGPPPADASPDVQSVPDAGDSAASDTGVDAPSEAAPDIDSGPDADAADGS